MIEILWSPQISNVITHHRITTSSWCNKIWKKINKSTIPIFSHSPGTKCRGEANNNREAVVACAKHVVKRPSKRSVLVYIYECIYLFICPELIEETVSRIKLIFGTQEYFMSISDKFKSQNKMRTHHGIMTSLSLYRRCENSLNC